MSVLVEVHNLLDEMLAYFSSNNEFINVREVKEKYFKLTGSVHPDTRDYEQKMWSFTEWLFFSFSPFRNGEPIFQFYTKNVKPIPEEILMGLSGTRFSLFKPLGLNSMQQFEVHDLLNDEKYTLSKDQDPFMMIKGELFIGRLFVCEKQFFILRGITPLPLEAKSLILQQTKKVKTLSNNLMEEEFLLLLESMYYKCLIYKHLPIHHHFVF